MPLPVVNGSLALQSNMRPGETTQAVPLKRAMLVRMSEETLDALSAYPNHPSLEFSFSNGSQGIYIGDQFFPMQTVPETAPHELYLRSAPVNKPSAPLKLYADITGKILVERELGSRVEDRVRESTTQAAKAHKNKGIVRLNEAPPTPTTATSTTKKGKKSGSGVTVTRRVAPQVQPIKARNEGTHSASAVVSFDDHPARARMIRYLAIQQRTAAEAIKAVGGSSLSESTAKELAQLLEAVATPIPAKKGSKDPTEYKLKSSSFLDVRPYDWDNLADKERTSIARAGRIALADLKIPESDPRWDQFRYRSTASGSSTTGGGPNGSGASTPVQKTHAVSTPPYTQTTGTSKRTNGTTTTTTSTATSNAASSSSKIRPPATKSAAASNFEAKDESTQPSSSRQNPTTSSSAPSTATTSTRTIHGLPPKPPTPTIPPSISNSSSIAGPAKRNPPGASGLRTSSTPTTAPSTTPSSHASHAHAHSNSNSTTASGSGSSNGNGNGPEKPKRTGPVDVRNRDKVARPEPVQSGRATALPPIAPPVKQRDVVGVKAKEREREREKAEREREREKEREKEKPIPRKKAIVKDEGRDRDILREKERDRVREKERDRDRDRDDVGVSGKKRKTDEESTVTKKRKMEDGRAVASSSTAPKIKKEERERDREIDRKERDRDRKEKDREIARIPKKSTAANVRDRERDRDSRDRSPLPSRKSLGKRERDDSPDPPLRKVKREPVEPSPLPSFSRHHDKTRTSKTKTSTSASNTTGMSHRGEGIYTSSEDEDDRSPPPARTSTSTKSSKSSSTLASSRASAPSAPPPVPALTAPSPATSSSSGAASLNSTNTNSSSHSRSRTFTYRTPPTAPLPKERSALVARYEDAYPEYMETYAMITKQRRLLQKLMKRVEQDEDAEMSNEEDVLEPEEYQKLRDNYEAWTQELAGITEKCRRVGVELTGLAE